LSVGGGAVMFLLLINQEFTKVLEQAVMKPP